MQFLPPAYYCLYFIVTSLLIVLQKRNFFHTQCLLDKFGGIVITNLQVSGTVIFLIYVN
jgi:hypothetical protein